MYSSKKYSFLLLEVFTSFKIPNPTKSSISLRTAPGEASTMPAAVTGGPITGVHPVHLLTTPITWRYPYPCNVELFRYPNRAFTKDFIQNVIACIGNRFTIGNTCPIWINRLHSIPDIPERGFSWSTYANYLSSWSMSFEAFRYCQSNPITTEKDATQRRQFNPRTTSNIFQQHFHHGGH